MTRNDLRALVLATVVLELGSGVPYGAIMEMVPIWLRVQGTGLAEIGALTLVGLPWTLKPFWAPLVDRYGTLRLWMLAGMTLVVGALLPLGGMAAESPGLVQLLVLAALGSATADLAIDAYIVARVPAAEQGRVTGVRIAAYRGAMALSGGGATWVGSTYGWNWGFGAVVGLQAIAVLGCARLAPVGAIAPNFAGWGHTLRQWLLRPGTVWLLLMALIYKVGDSAMAPMTRPYLLDAGLTAGEVGLVSTSAGSVLTALGALVGGWSVSRFGIGPMIVVLGSTQALSNLGYAGAAELGGRLPAFAASISESLTAGLGTSAMMALAMRGCRDDNALLVDSGLATRWAIISGLQGLTRTLTGAISGIGAERLGYTEWFLFTFLLGLPALLLAGILAKHYPEAK